MNFYSYANNTHFPEKGFELSLVLKMFNGAETSKSSCLPSAENLLAANTVICNYYRLRLPPHYYSCNSAEKRQPVQGKVVRFNPSADEL